MRMTNEALIELVRLEIARMKPEWPSPLSTKVLREKRATFSCDENVNCQRPGVETPVTGLYLAGDYTNTGYPATLEGAVLSGIRAAEKIIEHHQENLT